MLDSLFRKPLAFFGIDLAEGRWFPIRVRRRLAVVMAIGMACLLVGSGTFFFFSSKSWFCKSCHIMKPYYESWQHSTHGKEGVECIECHFPPGFQNAVASKIRASAMLVSYLTGTNSTKARAEVEDASCMRPGCHEKQLLKGKVDFDGVHFDHGPHLTELRRGKRLRCQTCHSQIVQGSHITVSKSVCFTCHFKDLKHGRVEEPVGGCTGCHDVPAKPVALANGDEYDHADYPEDKVACYKCHFDDVQGDGNVPRQVCIACHSEPEHLDRFDDHEFMHQNHVTDHKVECFHCHSEIRHGKSPEAVVAESTCNRCHGTGHDYTGKLYRGVGARGVKDQPSGMSLVKVQCIACHQILDTAKGHGASITYKAGEVSCIECHGDDVEGMLAEWKEEAGGALKKAEAEFAQAEKAAAALKTPEAKQAAVALLDDARHNLRLVQRGRGVHNMEYAEAVLDAVRANAKKILALDGPTPTEAP